MPHTQHIRLSGHAEAVALTDEAHQSLLRYLADARTALTGDPDADETVRDLEATLGEKIREIIGSTETPLSDAHMSQILAEVGTVTSQHPTAGRSSAPPRGDFWCRIQQGKWFGGLCLGIAARGSFRVDWVRTVVLLLALVTAGLLAIVYLALLLFVPSVESVDEYRRMRDQPHPQPA